MNIYMHSYSNALTDLWAHIRYERGLGPAKLLFQTAFLTIIVANPCAKVSRIN